MKMLILICMVLGVLSFNSFAGFEGKSAGSSIGVFNKINCSTGLTCTKNSGAFTIVSDAAQFPVEGLNSQTVAIFDYNFADDGGAIGTIASGVSLPANALIEQCWFRVETQLIDAGSGTLAVTCEDANNIFSAADFTGNAAGSIVAGAPLGTVATMVDDISASCDISYVIAGAALTAGKIRGYCRYTVHE